jgi:ribosomal protein S18 acetylase RimI-like enzyme
MQQFISLEISEKELFELTKQEKSFDAIYLCSAIVLEEYRRQGIASRLCEEAINSIQALHPITSLFVWAFTPEGETASDAISKRVNLPLLKRPN